MNRIAEIAEIAESLIDATVRDEGVLSVLTRLKKGEIEEVVADFAESFCFNDRGLGLEFTDKDRLREFFQKEREFYPGSTFRTKKALAVEDYAVAEWLLEYSINEPFYGNALRNVLVSLHGVTVIRTRKGKIIEWSDYYDGLISRRTALTSYFTDWNEL